MLQVDNQTPFAASLSVFPDVHGIESAYLVVKATFGLTAQAPRLADAQVPLLATDAYWGDPTTTSLRAAGEFALPKPATDVLLIGRAIAPAANTRVAEVSLRVGPITKTVRVFGDRQWQRRSGRWQPSEPAPWERMPLRWELAFGGAVREPGAGPDAPVRDWEPRNPVGRGLIDLEAAGRGEPLLLPNLEDPAAPISSDSDRPAPACFAPIAPTWIPRRTYAGTYDEAWTKSRAPYLPADFDARYFQLAHADLIAPGYLEGGEAVELRGFTQGEPLRFDLPALTLDATFDFDGRPRSRPLNLESVLFEPDAGRLQMLWRAGLAVDKKLLKLRAVKLRCAQYGKDGRPPVPLAGVAGARGMPSQYAAA
jgi:hypothetical protein